MTLRDARRASFAALFGGVALGAVEILVARHGVLARPQVGAIFLAVGFAAGWVRLRYSFVIAVLLGCNQGFIVYFVGGAGRYWKEAMLVGLVIRAVRRQLPSPLDLVVLCGLVALATGYALAGSGPTEIAWGFKLLVIFAFAGWAIARLQPTDRDWLTLYFGLAAAVAAAIPFALWQKARGVDGLLALGYPYGVTIRVANGSLRAFAGFTYGAPFAYTVAIAALCWTALFLTRQRQIAVATLWVPVAAAIGIAVSLSRIALVGAAVAVVVGAMRFRDLRLAAAIALAACFVAFFLGQRDVRFLGQGFTFGSTSAQARESIWSSRWSQVSSFGAGPSSAGAAFDRAHPTMPGPAASTSGVVDNLYLSWLFQYGIVFGSVLIGLWLVLLLRLFRLPAASSPMTAAAELTAVFAVVAAFAVNVWEEFPLNLLVAILLGCGYASRRRRIVVPDPESVLDHAPAALTVRGAVP